MGRRICFIPVSQRVSDDFVKREATFLLISRDTRNTVRGAKQQIALSVNSATSWSSTALFRKPARAQATGFLNERCFFFAL